MPTSSASKADFEFERRTLHPTLPDCLSKPPMKSLTISLKAVIDGKSISNAMKPRMSRFLIVKSI